MRQQQAEREKAHDKAIGDLQRENEELRAELGRVNDELEKMRAINESLVTSNESLVTSNESLTSRVGDLESKNDAQAADIRRLKGDHRILLLRQLGYALRENVAGPTDDDLDVFDDKPPRCIRFVDLMEIAIAEGGEMEKRWIMVTGYMETIKVVKKMRNGQLNIKQLDNFVGYTLLEMGTSHPTQTAGEPPLTIDNMDRFDSEVIQPLRAEKLISSRHHDQARRVFKLLLQVGEDAHVENVMVTSK